MDLLLVPPQVNQWMSNIDGAIPVPFQIFNPDLDWMLLNPMDGYNDYAFASSEEKKRSTIPFFDSPQRKMSKLERLHYLRQELHRLESECVSR